MKNVNERTEYPMNVFECLELIRTNLRIFSSCPCFGQDARLTIFYYCDCLEDLDVEGKDIVPFVIGIEQIINSCRGICDQDLIKRLKLTKRLIEVCKE